MDTQPRAEDEVLSQETQSGEHVASSDAKTTSVALTAADVALEASAESAIEADEDVELSAEELVDEWQASPEIADEQPAHIEAEELTIEGAVLEEALPVELAPEELVIDELATVEQAAAEAAPAAFVTEVDFEQLVDEALEAVGGILLFKMRIDDDGEDKHIAAASIGDGARRQFLLLSLPVAGGKLKVESASRSKSPLAKLAEAYVGVVEAFRSAA